ncbi:MAG: PAS domain S-box protein, partial [Methanoregula sp.]|nr:PAS domain S-box protein [Methanoregula sp.]
YLSENLVAARDNLKVSGDIQQGIIQNANVWLMVLEKDGRIREWNRAAEVMSGYSARDVVGTNTIWKQLYPDPGYRKEITGMISEIISKNNFLENIRTTISCRDGSTKIILWNTKVLPHGSGQSPRFIAVGVDVTDRERAEAALRKSEGKYHTLFENMFEGFAYCRMIYDERDMPVDWVYLSVNRSFERITGQKGVEGKRVLEVLPDFRTQVPELFDTYGRVAITGTPERFEQYIKPLGVWHHISAFSPEKGYFVAVFEDITEGKASQDRIQEMLRIQEQQLRIINTSPAVSFLWKAEENWPVEMVSENISQFGYASEDFLSGRILFSSVIHPDDLERIGGEVKYNSTHHIDDYTQEYRMVGKNNKVFRVVDFTHIRRDASGTITHYEGIILDITLQKQAEEQIRASRQILEGILNTIPVRVFWKDKELTFLGCNTPFARDAGFEKPEDVIGRDDYSMGWRDQAELYRADDRAVIESRKPKFMIEEPQTTPDGETIYLLTSKLPLLDINGDAVGILGTYIDITERKRMEAQLRESRQLFSDIISFLPDPTFVIDKDGNVLAWNRAFEKISGIPAAGMIGKGNHEYSIWQYGKRRPILIDLVLHPDQDYGRMGYTEIQQEGRSVMAQTELIRPDHKNLTLSLVASPLYDAQGTIVGAIESMRDITRIKKAEADLSRLNTGLEKIVRDRTKALEDEVTVRKQAEVAIRASLDEKVLLLREIHHRVNNNLQIIISLTKLQMRTLEDPRMKQALAEMQNRVRAMSLVHEKLYRSENLSSIDLAEYTRFLANQLFSFYGIDHRHVALQMEIEKTPLDIDTAIPLGLVLNELISNALRHAFPDNRTGTLSISSHPDGDVITLVIKDDGHGMSPDFDWKETESLGFRLVNSLVDQLGGTIDKGPGQGTTFIIRLPRKSTGGSVS